MPRGAELVRGAAIVVDHGQRVVHVAAAAAAQRRGALSRRCQAACFVGSRRRRASFSRNGARSTASTVPAARSPRRRCRLPKNTNSRPDDVEHRHRIDDAEDIARDQRAGGRHLAFGREHAQPGHALARRAPRHQRLEDQVIEEVDSRRGQGAGQVPERLVVGADVEAGSCRGSATRRAAGRPARARRGSASRAGTRWRGRPGPASTRRASTPVALGTASAGGARVDARARRRIHAAPRCSSSASCSAWCSCCSESSNSSILPCMMSPSLYSVRLMR